VSAAVFVTYLLTLCPTVIDQDSGELVAAAHVLGVPHPTGYPLWTMLARAFDFLPVGHTSAYRIALLSAASAAGAAGLVTWLVIALTGVLLPGVFAGLAFAFWLPTWSQAVRPEVYALEALLFAMFLVALWRWDGDRSPQRLRWLALAGGFVAMHHRTGFLAVAPALAAAFWLTRPRRAKAWVTSALLFLAPFLCYLYLPLRAAARPPMNWGDPVTLGRFLDHVFGRQYARWAFANPLDAALAEATKLSGEVLAGSGWASVALAVLGVPLIVWGLVAWSRRRPVLPLALTSGAILLSLWVMEWGDTSDSKVWLTPLGAALAILGGQGLARLTVLLPRAKMGPLAAAAAGAAVCLMLVSANWSRSDQSNVWKHRDRWHAALAQMDRNAIFVCEWDDPMFATYYLQNVEGFRNDITLIRPHGLWGGWYEDLIEDRELREAAPPLWREISAKYHLHHPGTEEFWEGTALLAHRLAQHYQGRRTVYALHGPYREMIPGPPHFVGLSDHLYRLGFETPELTPIEDAAEPIAEFLGGVELVSFEVPNHEPLAGDVIEFRARWRLADPLPGALFAVKLAPTDGNDPARARLTAKGEFAQGFPVLYGRWGLPPSPSGTVYEQRGKLIVPSNAPSGEYTFEIGSARSYPPKYEGWTAVPNQAARVSSRPLPTNGP
jgi:hypothetical protein